MLFALFFAAALCSDPPAPSSFLAGFSFKFNSPNPPSQTNVVLRVTRSWAPLGVDHFFRLLNASYYNQNGIFRVVPNFVVQFGINGNPSVSNQWNTPILDDPVIKSNVRGTLSYATSGPNSRTTQLFINLVNNSFLDSMGFAPFAEVTQGMDVIDQIYAGYGENPDQGQIYAAGNSYLQANFPLLTYLNTANVIQ